MSGCIICGNSGWVMGAGTMNYPATPTICPNACNSQLLRNPDSNVPYACIDTTLDEIVPFVQFTTVLDPEYILVDQDHESWFGVLLNNHTVVVASNTWEGPYQVATYKVGRKATK